MKIWEHQDQILIAARAGIDDRERADARAARIQIAVEKGREAATQIGDGAGVGSRQRVEINVPRPDRTARLTGRQQRTLLDGIDFS